MTTTIEDCPVCYKPEPEWKGSTKSNCGHTLCMQCFLEWTVGKQKLTCPICRANLKVDPEPVQKNPSTVGTSWSWSWRATWTWPSQAPQEATQQNIRVPIRVDWGNWRWEDSHQS